MNEKKKNKVGHKRKKQTRYLSQAIQLEEAVNPHVIRATMSVVSIAILTFIVWAHYTSISEVARTPGEVVPQGYQQTVQHLEGGIVKDIKVHDGDIVKKGQILLSLSDASIQEDLQWAYTKQVALELQIERLRSFVEKRKPDFSKFSDVSDYMINDQESFFDGMVQAKDKEKQIIKDQIAKKRKSIEAYQIDLKTAKKNLEISQDIYQRNFDLNKKGYSSDVSVLELKKQMNSTEGEIQRLQNQIIVSQAEIREFQGRLNSLSAQHKNDAHEKLDNALVELSENKEIIDKLEERIGRLQLRAPVHGLIKGLAVNTVGAVIAPGQVVMEIVPLDQGLEVAVKISPRDIGHLKIGQPVQVKFSTFDFSRYGSVNGRLEQISATTFAKETGERYYQGRIMLDKNYVGHNKDNMVTPGMTVMADIITGEKTILQYLLKPIHVSLLTAFRER